MMRHMISVEKIVGESNLYYHEWVVAGSYPRRLSARTSISKSGQVDTMFFVYDLSKPQDQQLVLIASDLQLAIDRYNEL